MKAVLATLTLLVAWAVWASWRIRHPHDKRLP